MISRRLDKLGRIVLPQEMRSKLNITPDTLIDIALEGDKIILSKSSESCVICGATHAILEGTQVCHSCAEAIAAKLK